ncbi:MAG TPA: glutamine synthetase family protein, partial [Kiloniellales bacterium]|nr:glutamine synthetase family protein [Kiloniellales bacterium]
MESIEAFLKEHSIDEVECLVPDMAGIARGKILPAGKFLKGMREQGLRIPEGVFVQTVTGDYPIEGVVTSPAVQDVYMVPDPASIRLVPWYEEPTAQIICDAVYLDGSPVEFSSRAVLRRVLELYEKAGWQPLVAPELEFFLVGKNTDPDYPLEPPIGRSGRRESSRQSYGVDAVNEFDPLFEDVYDFCEAESIDIDTLTHESGAAQMEMNFNHGAALELADQAFLFKRTVREAALRHNVYATFMAKPMEGQPGSSMHIHQCVLDAKTSRNLFAQRNGRNSKLFLHYIAGLQKNLPAMMPLLAPNVNSYRRLIRDSDAPINTHWGFDNRTVGLRVPHSDAQNRRVENRVAGADANPYLAIAASLACGYIGMTQRLKPRSPVEGSAYRLAHTLPRTLFDALSR